MERFYIFFTVISSTVIFLFSNAQADNGANNETDVRVITDVKVLKQSLDQVIFSIQVSGDLKFVLIEYMEKVEAISRTKILDKNGSITSDRLGRTIITLCELVPGGYYNFNFSVETVRGGVDEWPPFWVPLLPEAPEVIFRYLKDNTLQIEWFRRVDDIVRGTIDHYLLSYNKVLYSTKSWTNFSDAVISITIPQCAPNYYTIADLMEDMYFEIRLKAHTSAGYGEPYKNKIYLPKKK